MHREWLSAVAVAALLFMVSACANANSADSSAKEVVPVYAPGSGGAGYLFASGISNLLNGSSEFPDVQFNAESIPSSIEMIQLVIERHEQGRDAVALVSSDSVYDVYNGQHPLVEGEHHELQAIGYLYGAEVYMVTGKDSKIASYADLKGKKVGIGAANSSVGELQKRLLKYYGIDEGDYTALPLGYAEVVEGLQNGSIDAGSLAGSTPVAAYNELSNSREVTILSVEDEIMEQFLQDYPFYSSKVIPSGSYKGLDHDVQVGVFGSLVITHSGVDEETIYRMTKLLLENNEELKKVHPSAEMTPEMVANTVGIPFHPGAVKYFEERGIHYQKGSESSDVGR